MEPSIYFIRQRDVLTLCVLALLGLGALMVQSASVNVAVEPGFHWTTLATKHLLFVGVALVAFFGLGHLNYRHLARPVSSLWHSPAVWMLGVAAFTCLIVLIPHVGIERNGARRWLPLGFAQVQPSEVAKWSMVVFLSWWMTTRPFPVEKFFRGLIPTLIPIGIICLLVVKEDLGTAALIGLCSFAILLAGGMRMWHMMLIIPPALAAAVGFVVIESYRMKRLLAFMDPWAQPQKEGYHMIQSLLSFATGGVAGRGLGNGIQKLGYLPEDTTDFIFATICEELGLFGAILTVALYLGILWVVWQVIRSKRDDFGRLLAFGIGSMIGLQAAINIAVATVSVPTKGLSLPLVSAGGSGLVITCAALGLLYSVTRFEQQADELPLLASPAKTESETIPETLWKESTVGV